MTDERITVTLNMAGSLAEKRAHIGRIRADADEAGVSLAVTMTPSGQIKVSGSRAAISRIFTKVKQ